MFFQGSLQEGIATAVQQSKSVVCFVTDSGPESQLWEQDYLPGGDVSSLIGSHAVLLRLEDGSQEAGFLTQLYPIPKKPTLVIIKNGELKEYIAAGTSKEELVRRVQSVLQPTIPSPDGVADQPTPEPVTSQSLGSSTVSRTADRSAGSSNPVQATPPPAAPEASNEPRATQPLLVEQDATRTTAARLAAQKKRDEEASKRRQAEETAKAKESETTKQQHSDLLKKKQREAREERQRILKAIEDDKIARHARKAELEAERQAAASAPSPTSPTPQESNKPPSSSSNGRLSENCAIQVRLLDGSTIRNRFSSTSDTIQSVRKWVNEARTDGKTPYTFKILMTPRPSKAIDAAEESQSLRSLKLAPSATLIIVPVAGKRYTPAFSAAFSSASASSTSSTAAGSRSTTVANSAGDGAPQQDQQGDDNGEDDNIFVRFIAFIMRLIAGFLRVVVGFFTTLFSVSGPPQPEGGGERQQQQQQVSSSSTTSGRDRISGLGERQRKATEKRDSDRQQFYNGNSTNFEPRPDDQDE